MTSVRRYLDEIKMRLVSSACIGRIDVIAERAIQDRGYFRARMVLTNGDFLEISEYFAVRKNEPETLEYRYQWMDSSRQRLIRRWDNARHFPELPNFPDHVHQGDEAQVIPGRSMGVLDLIDLIEREMGSRQR
ncbi:MAG: hypothetical protein IT487_20010 [Chromatiaceae bacterium]|nr:hypothetical protein [Chromatiaceae bacterium]